MAMLSPQCGCCGAPRPPGAGFGPLRFGVDLGLSCVCAVGSVSIALALSTLIEDRLHWARSYLRKVGAIDSSERGVWSITPAGRALTEADMQKLVAQVRGMSRQNRPQPEEQRPETADDDQLDEVWRDQQDDLRRYRAIRPPTYSGSPALRSASR
jgi:Mrr restriction endonuclease-like protein